jgi:hypothetical protein
MFQYNGFTKPENYKNISDFYTEEKENPNEYMCINDFTKREIPSQFNIKNIGDINKINLKSTKYIQNRDMLRTNFINYKNTGQTFENLSEKNKFIGIDYPMDGKPNFNENMSNNNINHIADNLSNAAANNFGGLDVNNNFKDQMSNYNFHKKPNNIQEFKRESIFEPFNKMETDPLNNMKNTLSNNTNINLTKSSFRFVFTNLINS